MNRLEGKVAIITGGNSGVGAATAQKFAAEGAKVVITARREAQLEEVAAKIREAGGEVLPVVSDISKAEDAKRVVAETIAKFGKVDVLINNAQASASGVPLADHSTEQFNLALYSGLYAAFYYMKACYPYLKQSRGSVINFASGAGLFGRPGQSSYAAAKEGIRGMSRVAAAEWGPDGIRGNVICPLAMTESLEQWRDNYPELFQKTIQGIPLGRFADPRQDIGRVCVFLASDDASYVTGETITLQGGSGLRP